MRFSVFSLIINPSLYDIFVGGSAAVAVVLRDHMDISAVPQFQQIAADRIFG
jgi:hypothetical protein